MDFMSQVVPAALVLAANLLSGPHSSLRWAYVTAVFGWGACIGFAGFLLAYIAFPSTSAGTYFMQFFAFCLLTALSRDYERILRPLFKWNR